MTHRYQVEGRDIDCQVGGDAVLEYSNETLADLIETQLNEGLGMCDGTDIDWNLNGQINGGIIQANINCFPRPDLFDACPQTANLISPVAQHGFK